MTPRYPGAVWMPSGSDQGGNNGPVAFSWHEAVTTGTKEAIAGWVSQSNACHAFVGQYGDTAQYKDFDRIAYGVLDGNRRGVVTIETWDGLLHGSELTPDGRDANHSSWDPGQVERVADMIAWADVALGIPIHFMANTRERGHAPHRLGVPEASGRVQVGFGPDRWTSHPGKACCGDLRIEQLRDVCIPRARVIAAAVRAGKCGWLPAGRVNLASAYARTGGTAPGVPPVAAPTPTAPKDPDMAQLYRATDGSGIYVVGANVFRLTGPGGMAAGQKSGQYSKDVKNATVKELEAMRVEAARPNTGLAPSKPAAQVSAVATTKVAAGETLSVVAKRTGKSVADLVAWNKIANPDNIEVGQVLRLGK